MSDDTLLTPGEILNKVHGLTRTKLDYWVDKRYISVIIQTRTGRDYRHYEERHIPILKKAVELSIEGGMKDKEAFNRIYNHYGFSK
jgi:hypothetical protein